MVRRVRSRNHYGEQRIFTVRSIVAAITVTVLLLTVASRLFFLRCCATTTRPNSPRAIAWHRTPFPPAEA